MFKLLVTAFVFSCAPFAFGAQKISESFLIELARKKAPTLEFIKASLLSSQNLKNEKEELYAPELFGRGSYAETNERPLIDFLPVFSPVKTAQLGLRQRFVKGLQAEASVTTDQRSAQSRVSGDFENVTVSVLSLTVQMDLWKDLFGRLSDAERESARMEAKRAQIEQGIRTKAFEIGLRKVYWNLVANSEQLKISERLHVTAKQQLEDSRKRFRSNIGDEGEVARYEAEVAARRGQVIFLTFQKEAIIQQLKALLPDLGYETVELQEYDLDDTLDKVLGCSQVILGKMSVPYENTHYDEMVSLLREIKTRRRIINDRYADVDVKLYGTVKSTGVASDALSGNRFKGSYGDSFDDISSNNRSGYEAGLRFTMPLGDTKRITQDTRTIYDDKRLQAAVDEADARVISTHTQLGKSLLLLKEVIDTQDKNTRALERRLAVERRKFVQARVSVSDLILDQNALYLSEITTIDAKLQVLNVLLDYLMIFTETPCDFNRT